MLGDLYAYVDDWRAFMTGEELDEDNPPPATIRRREITTEEDILKDRIIRAMNSLRSDYFGH